MEESSTSRQALVDCLIQAIEKDDYQGARNTLDTIFEQNFPVLVEVATLPKTRYRVFIWVFQYIRRNRVAPTLKEIERALDLTQSSVQNALAKLKIDGYLTWEKGSPRSIRILRTRI
ncbi:hypothetical protein K9N68_37460 (plasmid) [Kovacikia minuta CCNUW1]|uniref:LexA family protein n=1 Tax=Kovacikia minuta TaxID=2931930 RepID=UPI001CCCE6A1|nr:hypothetical protein [Kovacikia minuta]UBF29902.1 hypothetical protein K9N68_37460 [Kovacikia minuta CCNUW1]